MLGPSGPQGSYLFGCFFLPCLINKDLSINFVCLFKKSASSKHLCTARCSITSGAIHICLQESGKSAQSQWQSLPSCSANESAQPVTPFRHYQVSRLLLPSLPLEPTARRLQPPVPQAIPTATGFLHPAAPQAPPNPSRYPAGLGQLYCSSSCLSPAVSCISSAHCSLNPW